jgi:hypothetical protein
MRDASFAGDISGHGQYGKVAARPGRTTLCLPTLGLRSYSAFIPESQIFALDLLVKGIASEPAFSFEPLEQLERLERLQRG